MRKQVLRLLAVASTVTMLASACGGADSKNDGGDPDKANLTFANWQWLEPNRGDAIWEAVSAYSKDHPGVTLQKQAIPAKDYETTMQTQMGAGQGPDILVMFDTTFERFRKAKLLEPVDDVLTPETQKTLNKTNDPLNADGKRWGFSWEVVNYAFFYNPELLAKAGVQPPTDLASLVGAAKAVKAKTGNPGFAFRHQMNEELLWWRDFSNWIFGYGGAWSRDNKLTIDDPKNVEAVRAFKEMYDSGAMPVGDDASTFRKKFAEGKIGMGIDNSSALYTMVNKNTVVPSAKVGVTPMPFPQRDTAYVGVYLAINANSKHKVAAKKWLAWFLSPEGQKKAASALGASTLATDTPPAEELVKANPWVSVYQAQAPNAHPSVVQGFGFQTPQIAHIVMGQIESVLVNNVDPAVALKKAQEEAQKLN